MSGATPVKVALLNFGYWPEVRRGNERLVHDLAGGLRDLGERPRIITSHPGRPTRTVEEGIPVIRHWRPPEAPLRLRRFQDHLTHVPLSYAELRRGDDDLAHAFFPSDGLAACRWARREDRPAVFTFTGIPQRNNLSNARLRLRILERILAESDQVLVLSSAARDGAWRWLGIEPRVINPGVDLSAFRPGRPPEDPTIACAADPGDQRKRVALLVAAFGRLRREVPNARLLLMEPRDPALSRELGRVAGVELHSGGADPSAEMFGRATVSALCSEHEAFGLVLIESLACGVPVVGTRHGAIPEVVDRPEVGRLFDAGDSGGLARALRETLELASAPGTAAACRARAEEFSAERTAREHRTLYRELLG